MAATGRILILLNPAAGGGRGARLAPRVRDWIARHADGAAFASTASTAEAQARVDDLPTGSRVVLVGGDGSLNRILPAALRGEHALASVPCGSGNDVASALGLRRSGLDAALAMAVRGAATPMDIGEAVFDGKRVPFLSSLTAGFDSAVGRRAQDGPAWLRGLPRYLWATMGELAALRLWPLTVTVDGEEVHRGPALFASTLNTPTFGGGMPAVPHARIDDGRLDLLLAGRFGRMQALPMLPRLLAGRHLNHPRVATHAFRALRITSPLPVPLAADGEGLAATCEVTVSILPAALRVVRAPG